MIKRTVSLLICILFSAALLSGCNKTVFSDIDPVEPYDEEETYDPPSGGSFALRQKNYRFGGKPVSVVSVENLGVETYDVYYIIQYRDADGKTVGVIADSLNGFAPGAKKYSVFTFEKEWVTKKIKFVSYPPEEEGYYDKIEFGSNFELYAHATVNIKSFGYDTAYSDPVLSYTLEFDYRNSSKTSLYASGKAVILDNNGEIFDIIPFSCTYTEGTHKASRESIYIDVPWDDDYVMPEEMREGVTGFICLDRIEPNDSYNISDISDAISGGN